MNGIIFDKYLTEATNDLVPHGLVLPPKEEETEVPYFGMLELEAKKGAKEIWMYNPVEVFKCEPKDFTEIFKIFCLQSILITPEAIAAL
jgi:dynein heavy chain